MKIVLKVFVHLYECEVNKCETDDEIFITAFAKWTAFLKV